MIPGFADNRNPHSLSFSLRRKRFNLFLEILEKINKDELNIIDLGGTAEYWQNYVSFLNQLEKPVTITIVNLLPANKGEIKIGDISLKFLTGDATNLYNISNNQFDVVYSNSVIEHVGNLNKQLDMANEIYRIAPHHFVQTPSRYFPVEAHVLLPFWPYWPLSFRGWLISKKQLAWMAKRPNYITAKAACEQVRLLTPFEMIRVFPKSRIVREKMFGITKSIIAHSKHLKQIINHEE